MVWDGSGNFSRTNGDNTGSTTWADDRSDGDKIVATRHDTHDQDLADGIAACLTKNNESKPSANFDPATTSSLDMGDDSLRWQHLFCEGVNFPATQVASSNANTLDDYEEGEFQVTISVGTGTITIDTSEDTLAYTKVGRMIHVQGKLNVTSVNSPSGLVTLTGAFPINGDNLTESADTAYVPVHYKNLNATPATTLGIGLLAPATGNMVLRYDDESNIGDDVQANTEISLSFSYFTA